ncbi:MAG: TraX family protein [Acetobacterium sp.]
MTSTTLKITALVLMFLDHVAQFIPGTPLWFHWLGRISAPLFIFCMIWGFHYTHDRKKYLLRMYCFGLGMGFINIICNNIYPNALTPITNNIFVTLFLIGIISWLIEYVRTDKTKGTQLIALFAVYQVITTGICIVSGLISPLYGTELFVGAISANLIYNEGSFIFVFLGVLLYFNKEDKKSLILSYGSFCLVYFSLEINANFSLTALFYQNYQWMMIAALPLMLLYNGRKGSGLKYLFYIFYPLHILILFLIGNSFF